MSWTAPMLAIEDRVAELKNSDGLPLIWAVTIPGPDDGNASTIGDGGRPDVAHIVWQVVYTGSNPLEVGWATEIPAGTPPVETTGEIQFDFYSPSRDGSQFVTQYANTIRSKFFGVWANSVRYGVPLPPQWLGNEPGGWSRWVMRVPFTIEDA